jgi:murein hydrolase activator
MDRAGSSFLIALLLLTFVAGTSGRAGADRPVENLENRLGDQQQKMHRLNKGIENQKGMVRQSRQREVELLSELERLEHQLQADRKRLAKMREDLNEHEDRLDFQQVELDDLLLDQEEIALLVKRRLAAYYRMGGVGVLNALFSTSSVPELLDLEEYLSRLVEHDRRTLASFRNKADEVNTIGKEIAAEKERLAAFYEEVLEQERRTAASQEQQLAFLRQVRTEKKLHQRAVSEMEKNAFRLTATLDKLREEPPALQAGPAAHPEPAREAGQPVLTNPERRPARDQGFAARKGQLPPPVAGTVVTGFGEEVPGQFGIATKTHGIDIKTEPGAPIKAIHAGKVVYAGYLRGYGNLLIIDHGLQYYSLMSRAARFVKEKNDEVEAGEVVGIMGDGAELPPEGLHFEIRHGSEPENPLSWLNPELLPAAADKAEKIRPDFASINRR